MTRGNANAIDSKTVAMLDQLREQGFRITAVRQMLIAELMKQSQPQTAQELFTLLQKKRDTLSLSTIYRELSFLQEQRLVRGISSTDQEIMFEIRSRTDHHHHLVCDFCGVVLEAQCQSDSHQLIDAVAKQAEQKGFTVDHDILSFHGSCQDCRPTN